MKVEILTADGNTHKGDINFAHHDRMMVKMKKMVRKDKNLWRPCLYHLHEVLTLLGVREGEGTWKNLL
jgi:hypothetical protein